MELRQGTTPLVQFEAWFANLSMFAPELVETEELRCAEFERKLCDDIRVRIVGSWHRSYSVLVKAATHVKAAVLAMGQNREETIVGGVGQTREKVISVTPSTYRYSKPSKKWKRRCAQSQVGSLPPPRVSDTSIGGPREVQDVSCFKCGLLGHKVSVCPQRKRAGLVVRPVVAPPEPFGQSDFGSAERTVGRQLLESPPVQILHQSNIRDSLTCWVCKQQGHLKRFCNQPGASLKVLQPSQAQFHLTGQGQCRFGGLAGQTLRASVESSSKAPDGEVCGCSRCGQRGHVGSPCPWRGSS